MSNYNNEKKGPSKTDIPNIPGKIPSIKETAGPSNIPSFLNDSKRSILKSSLRDYEADPVKLTPGLDPSQLSTSPIAEPILSQTSQPHRVRFASKDQIFQVTRK